MVIDDLGELNAGMARDWRVIAMIVPPQRQI
jgi:hypothetical protein